MLTPVALTGAAAMITVTSRRVIIAAVDLSNRAVRTRTLREFTDALSVELAVGARPVRAAEHALEALAATPEARRRAGAELVDSLSREIGRARLGGEVGTGVENQAEVAEAAEVAEVMRLWSVAQRHGLALGQVMRRRVDGIEAQLTHLGHTSSALAGARLTEIILLLLPVGALGIGQSMGLTPVGFLVGNVLGVLVLLAGILLACAGVLWVESLTVTVLGGVGGRAGPPELAAAGVLDVFAAALTSGMPVVGAWRVAVDATAAGDGGDSPLERVAALLELGSGAHAWRPLLDDGCFGPVARRAAVQARNGARMSEEILGIADRLRRSAGDRSRAGAERVLVAVAAPLTLCFLPAFVLVGLVPLVVGFAGV
ncbi:MAG TPA: type II secretion system F family protein [Candidatus Corynebacterium avicola]|uniref:Type II secretion system F family protein n=1 Tax=Candidatus Corynebacterium avicola TaxID=2838527 RepID=A0A9D1ULT4_9CORY|nr:type II secretion system F family protein [Candidatus Corynebacterium avicola]